MKKSTKDKIKIIETALRNSNFLSHNNYNLISIEKVESLIDKETFLFTIFYPELDKKLRLYIDFVNTPPLDQITLFVKKNGESIHIDGYLKHLGVINDYRPFTLNNYKGNFEEKFKKFLQFLEHTFSSHWKDVLLGDKWPDVPVDFGDYK